MDSPRGARLVPEGVSSATSTIELLQLARTGHPSALDRLFARYMPVLTRWARQRVPAWARGAADTSDLIQDTLLHALRNIDRFEPRQKGSLLHYLRHGLVNRIRDHVRNAARHPCAGVVDERLSDPSNSPLDVTIEHLERERFHASLARLRPADRLAIVTRVELGCSYEELKVALGSPTTQAARLFVRRALLRLANEMRRDQA